MTAPAPHPQLNDYQRAQVEDARQLLAADHGALFTRWPPDPASQAEAHGFAYGAARVTLETMLGIIDQLTGVRP